MATIENVAQEGPAAFRAQLANMPDEGLMAQDFVQQGAVHAVSFLLAHGCTESVASDMLASLRANAALIREEARRRGRPDLFDCDQTGFS